MADGKPGIDFSTFMISLGSSALVHLGDAPDPTSNEQGKPDLPMA